MQRCWKRQHEKIFDATGRFDLLSDQVQTEMKVLVTGANGFVGHHCVQYLLGNEFSVRAAVRHSVPADEFGDCRVVEVDSLHDRDRWVSALEGTDALVHLAARVHVMNDDSTDPRQEYWKTNVEGVRCLLEACVDAGVKHFVFLSTIKVNGESTTGVPFSSTDDPAPQDPYAESKHVAEKLVRQFCDSHAIGWTIIRPPLVYGPGVKANFARLVDAVRSGRPLPLGGCRNRRSMVYVGNLCDLISRVLRDERARGRTLLVSDGADVSVADLINSISSVLGRRNRLVYVPPWLLMIVGTLLNKRAQIKRLTQSLEVDIAETMTTLDWQPPYDLEDALRHTVHA